MHAHRAGGAPKKNVSVRAIVLNHVERSHKDDLEPLPMQTSWRTIFLHPHRAGARVQDPGGMIDAASQLLDVLKI
jgi:hypothetical protein